MNEIYDKNWGPLVPKENIVQKIRKRFGPPETTSQKLWRKFRAIESYYVDRRRVFLDMDRSFSHGPQQGFPDDPVAERLKMTVDAAVKSDRVQLAKAAAAKRNEQNQAMRQLVIRRWKAEKKDYESNKSDFARHYSRLLLQEHQFEVTASTIATRWLRGV